MVPLVDQGAPNSNIVQRDTVSRRGSHSAWLPEANHLDACLIVVHFSSFTTPPAVALATFQMCPDVGTLQTTVATTKTHALRVATKPKGVGQSKVTFDVKFWQQLAKTPTNSGHVGVSVEVEVGSELGSQYPGQRVFGATPRRKGRERIKHTAHLAVVLTGVLGQLSQ